MTKTVDDPALVQSLALLALRLVDDNDVCALAGITGDELDIALADPALMRQARAEAAKITLTGGRAEVRAVRALDAAAIRLQRMIEDLEIRPADVIAATNALCTLAGTREKLKARQFAPVEQAEPIVSYRINLGGTSLSADEHRLIREYRDSGVIEQRGRRLL